MSVFEHSWYREALSAELDRKKSLFGSAYTKQAMASHCGVQRPYMSRVLNKDGNLSTDQLYLACEFLGLSTDERRFVFMLYERENSYIPTRRKELEQEIDRLRQENYSTEKAIPTQIVDENDPRLAAFYLNPYFILIHLLLSMERYAKDPQRLKEVLGISTKKLEEHLESLADLGFIQNDKERWIPKPLNIHLTKQSRLFQPHRKLLRLKAFEKLDREGSERDYTFSALISTEPKIRDQILSRFLELLKEAQGLVSEGQSEEVYQINFDLLQWS